MNLAERYTEDEKIDAINKWLETVNEITSETVSLADPNDALTELDRENYSIVRYKTVLKNETYQVEIYHRSFTNT